MAHRCHIRVDALCLYHIAMVLRGNVYSALVNIPHRVVCTTMTIFQLLRGSASGQCHELVSQTHRKHHHIGGIDLLEFFNNLHIVRRIAGAVGKHQTVKSPLQNHLRRGMCREHRHLTSTVLQAADHILLHAQIQQRNLGAAAGINLHLGTRGLLHGALHPIGTDQLQLCLHIGILFHGNHAVHGTLIPQEPGNGPSIHPADARDPVLLQIIVQRTLVAKIASTRAKTPDDHCCSPGISGLFIFTIHTIIANEGIGHHYALSCIGRVGQDLLITNHRRIEHHLTDTICGSAHAGSMEDHSVFQNQSCFHLDTLPFSYIYPLACEFFFVSYLIRTEKARVHFARIGIIPAYYCCTYSFFA